MTKYRVSVATVLGLTAIMGCAAEDALNEDVVDADVDGLGEQQQITNTNPDGTWTATATATSPAYTGLINGSVTFTGPAGKTRKMGACNLRRYASSAFAPTTCTTVADCSSSPGTLPTGGARYCAASNSSGQKYCFYRPGSATDFCMGSPALAQAAVAPGTYSKQVSSQFPQSTWLTQACFEGCATIAPSNSVAASGYFPLGTYTLDGGASHGLGPYIYDVDTGVTLDVYMNPNLTPASFTWTGQGGCTTWTVFNNGQHVRCVKAGSAAPLPLKFTHASGTSQQLNFYPWPEG